MTTRSVAAARAITAPAGAASGRDLGKALGGAPARAQADLQEFSRLSAAGLTWPQARDRLAEWWPVPEVLAALAEAPEGEPFELEVELGGVPGDVARWLNPLVLRVLRCE